MQSEVVFTYQTSFSLSNEESYVDWITKCAKVFGASSLLVSYAFMNDADLHKLNVQFLEHDTLTDIITFDDTVGRDVEANIAVSIDRIKANAQTYAVSFHDELLRVMAHGLLHCLGFNDKIDTEKEVMKGAENKCIQLFHVEHNPDGYVS